MPLPIVKSRLDGDAAAYIARSGAQDRAAINAFVRGVKALGLWESMVCWPLRSSQNAGTGTTAYSMGGLGSYDGILVNGPTWETDGISFSASNRQITLPDQASLYGARTGFVVFKTTSNSYNQVLIEFQDGANSTSYYCVFRFQGQAGFGVSGSSLVTTRSGALSSNASQSRTISLTDFQSAAFTMDDSTDNVFRNGSIETSGARTGLSAINATGGRNNRILFGNSTGLTGCFGLLSSSKWTDSQINTFYTLYKTTVGIGLGLP